jgi:EAL domain-containing protein (putative c-di-GMP-specific phosphodiesterase class I)
MILTLDQLGQLAVSTPSGSFQVSVESLDDVHAIIEKYQIDFISDEVTEAHMHTDDEKLLNILKEFHLQRAYVIMAAAVLKRLPQA